MAYQRIIVSGEESRTKIGAGIAVLESVVGSTLGPKGRTVMLEMPEMDEIVVTKDGVSVAEQIVLEDHIENLGASLVKQVARKSADEVGDGTTTSVVLTNAIYHNYLKDSDDISIKDYRDGMAYACDKIVDFLRSNAKKIDAIEEFSSVASVSANNDTFLGGIVAEALKTVGPDGIVGIAKGRSDTTFVQYSDGAELRSGYAHPRYSQLTDNGMFALEDPLVVVYTGDVKDPSDVISCLGTSLSTKRPVVIFAEKFSGEGLSTIIHNTLLGKGIFGIPVEIPGIGDYKKVIAEDIAALTGARIMDPDHGMYISDVVESDMGTISSIRIGAKTTTLINDTPKHLRDEGQVAIIDNLVSRIREEIKLLTNDREIGLFKERIARLAGVIATVIVGGGSEVEIKEAYDRVEDSLHATKSAMINGVLPGGGVALVKYRVDGNGTGSLSFCRGFDAVLNAIESPMKRIITNGYVSDEDACKLISDTRDTDDFWSGYSIVNESMIDFDSNMVYDPLMVTVSALKNAVSVVSTIISTSSVVYLKREK